MRLPALLLALGITFAAAPAQAARVNYAIVIGNNHSPAGHPELAALRYADDDAARYYELFRRAGRDVALLATFDAETARRFPEASARSEPPLRSNLERVVAQFRRKMERDLARGDRPVLFLAYSGHGAEDTSGRYALTMLDEGITREYLFGSLLPRIPSPVTVNLIVDACRAETVFEARGAFSKERNGELATLGAAERELIPKLDLSQYPNVGALVASSTSEEAYEWSRIESGVFTHVVVSGLLGAADINGDRRVEYSEIEAFVSSATRGIPDPRAPRVRVTRPAGGAQRVLVDLDALADTVLLQGDPREMGRLSVQLDNGLYWLEANINTSYVSLALPAEVRALLRGKHGETVLDTSGSQSLALDALPFEAVSLASRGEARHPWEEGLFRLAYDRGYYQGFADSRGIEPVQFIEGPTTMDKSPTSAAGGAGPVVLGVAGAALILAAGVTGYVALDAKEAFDAAVTERASSEANQRYQTYGTISAVTGVLGAVATTGAVVWALTPSVKPDQARNLEWGFRAAATF